MVTSVKKRVYRLATGNVRFEINCRRLYVEALEKRVLSFKPYLHYLKMTFVSFKQAYFLYNVSLYLTLLDYLPFYFFFLSKVLYRSQCNHDGYTLFYLDVTYPPKLSSSSKQFKTENSFHSL